VTAFPITPYDGGTSSGWSGSDTSHERALTDDANGTTSARQIRAQALVDAGGDDGLTVSELCDLADLHHGQASGVLSNLHKDGRIFRLAEKRNKQKIYVTAMWVMGRPTEAYGRQKPTP